MIFDFRKSIKICVFLFSIQMHCQNCNSIIPNYENTETTTINRSNFELARQTTNGQNVDDYRDINSSFSGTGWQPINAIFSGDPHIITTPWLGRIKTSNNNSILIANSIVPDPYQSPLNLPHTTTVTKTGTMLGARDRQGIYQNFDIAAGEYYLFFSQLNATISNATRALSSSRWKVSLSRNGVNLEGYSKFMPGSNGINDRTNQWHRSFIRFTVPSTGSYRLQFTVENIRESNLPGTSTLDDTQQLWQENFLLLDNIELHKEGDCRAPTQLTKRDHSSFKPTPGSYVISGWVKEGLANQPNSYSSSIAVAFSDADGGASTSLEFNPTGQIIEGWQRIEGIFTVPAGSTAIQVVLHNNVQPTPTYFDDIRIHKSDGSMKSFVYDPITQRLVAELDENNYATLYEYDKEGGLVRVKKETERGVYTIQETRSSTSKNNTNQ